VITVYALAGYEECLKDELMNWGFLRTKDKIVFDPVLAKHFPVIEEIMNVKNYQEIDLWAQQCFSMPIETALTSSME